MKREKNNWAKSIRPKYYYKINNKRGKNTHKVLYIIINVL